MKKSKTMFVSLLSILMLAGCRGGTDSTVIGPATTEEKKTEITPVEPTDEKPLYSGSTYTGKLNLTGLSAAEKTELLGQMEGYAQKNHLTGIPLYGSGGYTLISERIQLPVSKNVKNYGLQRCTKGT